MLLGVAMKTELTKLGPLLLGGVSFYGDPISTRGSWDSENEIGKTWTRFSDFIAANPRRPYSMGRPLFYEVHIYGAETMSKGFFEVFVGEEVNTHPLPVALSAKLIPESDYVKITLCGREITGDWWKALDTRILPAMKAKRNGGFIVQVYDDKFDMDHIEDSEMNVLVPVQCAKP